MQLEGGEARAAGQLEDAELDWLRNEGLWGCATLVSGTSDLRGQLRG